MANFMPEPTLILPDATSLIAILDDPTFYRGPNTWTTKSLWLCALIERIKDEGAYPYNADIKERTVLELDLDPARYKPYHSCGDPLSRLIYNAQRYAHTDYLVANGYEPFTPELMAKAVATGMKIECAGIACTPRQFGDRWYAMPPRKRKRGYVPNDDTPVRLVK